eukprot:1160038-Pelagomonas_calceolata.AAC.3
MVSVLLPHAIVSEPGIQPAVVRLLGQRLLASMCIPFALRVGCVAGELTPVTLQVGCGADELIDLLMRCVLEPGDAIVDCPPTFTMWVLV